MPDDVRLLDKRQFAFAALEANRSRPRPDETGDRSQKRRFSGPVRPGEDERFSGRNSKRQAVNNEPAAALNNQVFGDELH